jgi:hypothetical protein
MRPTSRSLSLSAAFAVLAALTLSPSAGFAQSPVDSPLRQPLTDPGVVPDDMLTLVVGTRFVAPSSDDATAKAQFTSARIPLSAFNDTDHCVDQAALAVAKEYFTTLGRVMGKAGYFYFVPDAEIRKSVAMCKRLYQAPPKAWVADKTKVIAFGRVVPTHEAPALERAVR